MWVKSLRSTVFYSRNSPVVFMDPSVYSFLLQGAALGLTAAASPGPFQTFLVSQTLTGGWRRGAPVTLAPLVSDVPIVAIILLLLNRLPERFLDWISLAGGLFLIYLARSLWISWRAQGNPAQAEAPPTAPGGGLWRGVLMNALSPGPYTFWAFINGPILIAAWQSSAWHAAGFLVGFYGLMIGAGLVLVLIFHQARRLGPQVVRALTLVSILILLVFGFFLLGRGILSLAHPAL